MAEMSVPPPPKPRRNGARARTLEILIGSASNDPAMIGNSMSPISTIEASGLPRAGQADGTSLLQKVDHRGGSPHIVTGPQHNRRYPSRFKRALSSQHPVDLPRHLIDISHSVDRPQDSLRGVMG